MLCNYTSNLCFEIKYLNWESSVPCTGILKFFNKKILHIVVHSNRGWMRHLHLLGIDCGHCCWFHIGWRAWCSCRCPWEIGQRRIWDLTDQCEWMLWLMGDHWRALCMMHCHSGNGNHFRFNRRFGWGFSSILLQLLFVGGFFLIFQNFCCSGLLHRSILGSLWWIHTFEQAICNMPAKKRGCQPMKYS